MIIGKSVILLFILIHIFPQFILLQPNRVGIASNEFIYIHAIDCRRTLDPLLLAVHKDGHVLSLPLLLCGLLFRSQFLLSSCHLLKCPGDNAPNR